MNRKFDKVAVVMGGVSSERDISLRSGVAVVEGLRAAGYGVEAVVLDHERVELPSGIEAVFIALHGQYGEDGGIQSDLDRLGMPYVGSGAEASRRAFDKLLTRLALLKAGVTVPHGEVLGPEATHTSLSLPVVVKPPRQGSSVGVGWVFESSQWDAALAEARCHDAEVLVECYIKGREWTVGVVDGDVLPVVEIQAPDGRYDLDAKYGGTSVYGIVRASENRLAERCSVLALDTFRALGARGFGRVDFRIDETNEPFVLELNTIPGFTPTSLMPKAAAAAGISFPDLCARIMETAACDYVQGAVA